MFGENHRRGFAAGILFLPALFLLAPGAASAQSVRLRLGNGELPISRLIVGDDLWVGLHDAAPGAPYEFRLLDPAGTPIASFFGSADAAGTIDEGLLWPASGVVGCDCHRAQDPQRYLYADFAEAEKLLDGQQLVVQVLNSAGEEVIRDPLPALATFQERVYFSDAGGCPKRVFDLGEQIHLTILHPEPDRPERLFFLTVSQSWPLGQPFADVRGAHQTFHLPHGGDLQVLAVDPIGLPGPGSYDGLLRDGGRPPRVPFRIDGDLPSTHPGSNSNGGITILLDGCTGAPPV